MKKRTSTLVNILLTSLFCFLVSPSNADGSSKREPHESTFISSLLKAEIIELNFIWDGTSPHSP